VPRTAEPDPLSRRERQIMDVVWRAGQATAAEIQSGLSDPPSYSAVRALLAILVGKGHLTHEADGRRYVYRATTRRDKAGAGALKRLLRTFFENSPSNLVETLLSERERALQPDEVKRIRALLDEYQRRRP